MTDQSTTTAAVQSRPLVQVLNGPNLGRLGSRQPGIYGTTDHATLAQLCVERGAELGLDVQVRQSELEGELVSWLHQAADCGADVVLNAAAYTHYSYAVRDACAIVTETGALVLEVHLSNPHAREPFRAHSVLSAVVNGTIAGFGVDSYRLALQAIALRRVPATR